MAGVFDLIERRKAQFFDITGFEVRYHQMAGRGLMFETTVYSGQVAEMLVEAINRQVNDPLNRASFVEEPIEMNEAELRFSLPKWRVSIPYSALNGEVFGRLRQLEPFFRELSIASNTIRDHFFSLMNAAASFKACVRDSEKLLKDSGTSGKTAETSTLHGKKVTEEA